MPLLEQIKEILELLEEAKEDLKEWVEYAEENPEQELNYEYSQELIGRIESTLHDVGY